MTRAGVAALALLGLACRGDREPAADPPPPPPVAAAADDAAAKVPTDEIELIVLGMT